MSYEPRTEEAPSDEIDLVRLWAILSAGKWKIAACVLAAIVLAVFYLWATLPTYSANALLQVETNQPASPLQGLTSQLGQITGQSTSIAAPEMQIMKSRSVIGQTVRDLGLDIVAKPDYFPVIGHAIAKSRKPTKASAAAVPASQGFWFSHYAWQPAHIKVTRFDVPHALLGKPFDLRALGDGQYVLYGPEGSKILKGQVGKAASGHTPDGQAVGLFVQTLHVAAPPTDFTVTHNAWLSTVNGLSKKLSVSERGKDTGIVQIALQGHDRHHITQLVNAIANNYLQQNVEAQSEQAKKSLDFLNKQLPKLKSDVQTAERKLANYQQSNGQPVDLNEAAQSLLKQGVDLQNQQSKLKMKLAELRQTYTGKHPALEAARDQMAQLKQQEKQLQKKINKLPDAEKAILRLKRNVKVKTQLYTTLLDRAQQLRVMKAGTVGNVRIVDPAVPPVKPVAPSKKLALILAVLLGGIVGVGLVLLQAALRRGINDPSEIENQLGLPVYAVVPFSNWLERRARRAERQGLPTPVLARDHGDDVSVEALRSLRTSLYFAQMESGSNVILITGPAPGVGKSFISANLSWLLGDTGQRVIVVDADMRKGRLHAFTEGRQREPGLSQVLTGQVKFEDAVRNIGEQDNVQLLTSGQIPPNPSELLMRQSFGELIERLKQEYDLVIIDAPPILAVTDAAVIAAATPGIVTFMVARAGVHPMAELEESVKRFSRQDRKIAGVVFNAYRQSHAKSAGVYGGYYEYEYKASS
ncbi:polysaccharide biosynthesis tyrosine autokinase [Salinisphaera hydrothermalis]|uniref:Chain length determinant protein n=1 Tax=Salinisphaera hydrothermalis (strain C41B8) TaxID=1304275 RepID=A0A084IQ13_SALHC|nr:polysaccharide biosynthesis tyrosine autokinase [Salinisphaera hydrothermalis]KEZ78797.1 chain length determinant protein [Salinisphaera hydrothermalis C41B8]